MRDPFSWSFPLGRLFGIQIKVHILFPIIALGLILRATTYTPPLYYANIWVDVCVLMAILAVSVLLHEFGHCFAARAVNGEATEVLLWPLGGLASVELPQQPRAHFLTAAAGPATNLLIALACAVLLGFAVNPATQPPWYPLWKPWRVDDAGAVALTAWSGASYATAGWPALLARVFWVNWVLFLLNLLPGFPLDGGRMLQAALWPRCGYRPATLYAIVAGFVCVLVVGLVAIIFNEVLAGFLAVFIYFACRNQWIILETGGEDALFGYDFSQGYTSLERDMPAAPARPKRQSWWQRWRQKRLAQKLQREEETRVYEEGRMDALLEKVAREGMGALTDEERRFLKRVSDRYRNRH
jgi:Zn-dependent protease